MKRSSLLAFAFALLASGALETFAHAKGVSGAIFTTDRFGSIVNGNKYSSKCDVYLDGGPGPNAPASAAGLPDGEYYFQVTDPSGDMLLSQDPISNRKFRVAGGVIVEHLGSHGIGIDQDHSAQGAITVQLGTGDCSTDYADTPNNGGVYKVWATPVADYVDPSLCGNGCVHGFRPAKSKTDNFKVEATQVTFCLTVLKEFPDEFGEYQPRPGWTMYVTDEMDVTNSMPTDEENGAARFCGLLPGEEYTVREDVQLDTHIEELWVNGNQQIPAQEIYSFIWTPGSQEPVILFRNAPNPSDPPPSIQ